MSRAKSFLLGKWTGGDSYKYSTRAPGVQPHSIERKDFALVTQLAPSSDDIMLYLVGEKTDGERRIFVSFEGLAILFDRKYNTTLVEHTSAIPNVIMDGELVGKKFIVHDVICMDNVNVQNLHLLERLELAAKFKNEWKGDLKIRIKSFITPCNLHKGVPSMGTKTDGLIFTPVFPGSPVFKWKPGLSNTIDFLYIEGAMYLYDSNFPDPVWHHDTDEKWPEHSVVECKWNPKSQTWYGLKQRCDKNTPNSRYVYYCTLTNIKEDIQEVELAELFS